MIERDHKDIWTDVVFNFGTPRFNVKIESFRAGWNRSLPISSEDTFLCDQYGEKVAEVLRFLQTIPMIGTASNVLVEGTLAHIETRPIGLVLDQKTVRTLRDASATLVSGIRKEGQPLFQMKPDFEGKICTLTLTPYKSLL